MERLFLQYEVGAEVFLLHNLIGSQFVRRTMEEYATFKEEVCAISDVKSLVNVAPALIDNGSDRYRMTDCSDPDRIPWPD